MNSTADTMTMPLSDLFQQVCEEVSVETILDVAESWIGDEGEIRDFLRACLGEEIY